MKMKTNINALCLLIIALCYINKTEAATCSALFGPNGARQCIKISGYTDYQWATCRRDSYIKSTSGGKHGCIHPLSIYCLYHCMLEKYEKSSGDVNGTCQCTPSTPVPTSSPSSSASTSSPGETGQCDAYRGPNGARQCIKISGYNDYQWATCRTDSYLKSTSGGRHHCSHPFHTYCLYQCMLEKHDKTSGDVNGNCQCTPSTPVPTSSPSSSASTSSPGETGQCNAFFGPNGARQCIKTPGYTDYQWATCRTDSYLKSTSGGRHHCSHPFHTYCLYQCMLEKHDKTSGDVKGNCLCTPSSTVPTSSPSSPVSTSSPSPPVTTSSPSSPAFTSSPRKTGQCDAYRGPNGARQCIKISGYTDYQWVTCRTDSYLKSTSGGRHHCRNPLHIYCLYQCMVEMYDRSSGDVFSSCRCTPVPTSSPSPPVPTISPGKTNQCHAYSGPNGARQCVKISGYTDYQWATCRTDSYLKATSGGRYNCRNPLHTYCLYQCMVEMYGQSSGDVLSSCRCTPGENSASQKKYTLVFVVFVTITSMLVS